MERKWKLGISAPEVITKCGDAYFIPHSQEDPRVPPNAFRLKFSEAQGLSFIKIIPGACDPCELLRSNELARFKFGTGSIAGLEHVPEDQNEGPPTVKRVDLWPETRPGLVYYIHTHRAFSKRIIDETPETTMNELREDYKWARQWQNHDAVQRARMEEVFGTSVSGMSSRSQTGNSFQSESFSQSMNY